MTTKIIFLLILSLNSLGAWRSGEPPEFTKIVLSPSEASIVLWKKNNIIEYKQFEKWKGKLYKIELIGDRVFIQEIPIPEVKFDYPTPEVKFDYPEREYWK